MQPSFKPTEITHVVSFPLLDLFILCIYCLEKFSCCRCLGICCRWERLSTEFHFNKSLCPSVWLSVSLSVPAEPSCEFAPEEVCEWGQKMKTFSEYWARHKHDTSCVPIIDYTLILCKFWVCSVITLEEWQNEVLSRKKTCSFFVMVWHLPANILNTFLSVQTGKVCYIYFLETNIVWVCKAGNQPSARITTF